jgi:uncharacterized protein YcfJ
MGSKMRGRDVKFGPRHWSHEEALAVKHISVKLAAAMALALLGGCATQPMGPRVAVMPAPNKPFAVFQDDDVICRNYARQQSAGVAEQANTAQLGTAAIGTVLGAGLGAAAGGGKGAAIGAGAGALGGTAVGTNQAERGTLTAQQLYDNAYSQCMYSRGNQVPGFAPAAPSAAPPPPPPPPPAR